MTTKRDFVKERCERAIEAFKDHELVDNREDRWRIARRDKDGRLTNVHAAEIVSLWGGRIYVGGDIDDCVFAYYGDHPDHLSKLRWMGRCNDVAYYVAQKAGMGLTDNGKLTREYDAQIAEYDLKARLEDELERIKETAANEEESSQDRVSMRSIFDQALERVCEQEDMLHTLRENFPDAWEWAYDVGMIVSHRVVYAWAALRRLCELLDEVEHAKV